MRIRIRLDIRRPLKRKKKIVRKDGTEFTVSCKYVRLGEFCFSCGMVTHTDRFCRLRVSKETNDGAKDSGSWLRAPPRRAAGQQQSKWLREEGDDTWEARIGQEINSHKNYGRKFSKKDIEIRKGSDCRELVGKGSQIDTSKTTSNFPAKFKGFNTTSNLLYGLNEEDNDVLHLEERKRRRSELEGVGQEEGSAISIGDLSAPTKHVLAELAMQASRSK